jgi:hypothetical protein
MEYNLNNSSEEETIIDYSAVIDQLEKRFSDRGLKFTIPFMGAVPVQAYGYIDGERFYFRFRRDIASIKTGVFNRDVEEKLYEIDVKNHQERVEKNNIELSDPDLSPLERGWLELTNEFRDHRQTGDEKDYYPTPVLRVVSIENYTGKKYAGDLTPEEAEDVFSRLLIKLEIGENSDNSAEEDYIRELFTL